MTAIWFILALMTGLAVLALLWPLTRRAKPPAAGEPEGATTQTRFYEDQLAEIDRDLARGLIAPPEAEAARTEAARRLLRANREDETVEQRTGLMAEPKLRHRRAASAFALSTVPLVALLVYGVYGSPNLPSQTAADREAARSGGQDLMKAIAQIEAKLASDPNDARGWGVIAPVYMRLGRFDDAARAYENLVRINGEDADRLSSWGEALVAAGEGNVSAQARSLFERALAVDPKAAKPQFYLARGDELSGNRADAIARLKALAEQGPVDAPWMGLVKDNLARLGNEGAPAEEAGSVSKAKPAEGTEDGLRQVEGNSGANSGAKSESSFEAKPSPPAAGPSANLEALPPAERMAAIRGMVENLDRRLSAQGGSVDEWIRLVRSYGALGQRNKALSVLERARKAFAEGSDERNALEAQARELGLAAVQTPAKEQGEAAPAAADLVHPPGNPEAEAAIRAMPPAERDAMIRQMVDRLAQRLSAKGGSTDEWMRLVRSYSALGDRRRAADAFERARMALAADNDALDRLDTLGRELKLRTAAAKK